MRKKHSYIAPEIQIVTLTPDVIVTSSEDTLPFLPVDYSDASPYLLNEMEI